MLAALGFDSIGGMGFIRHAKKIIVILIILGLGVFAIVAAGNQRIAEWVEVNLLTVSTKAKQAKYLELAARHLDEPTLYGQYLGQAEEMAEAILFLDGKEFAVAERFEAATREQEQILGRQRPIPYPSLAAARIENENIYLFMVKNYQFNDADIKKYQGIIDRHIAIVEALLREKPNARAAALIAEARKYQAAGLNIETYEYVKKAKDVVYAKLK